MEPNALRLVVSIADELFGPMVAKVARTVLMGGTSRLEDIVRESGLTGQQCKLSLAVLIHHNFVEALQHSEETSKGVQQWFVYRGLGDRLRLTIRWPRFLLIALERFGPAAEALVEALMMNGRLPHGTLIATVANAIRTAQEEEEEAADPSLLRSRTDARRRMCLDAFQSLLASRLVERVPPCTLPDVAIPPHPASVPTKRSRTVNVIADPMEAGHRKALVDYERERFASVDGADGVADKGARMAGSKRPAGDSLEAVVAVGQSPDVRPQVVHWRVNVDEFNRIMRDETLVAAARQHIGDAEANAVAALLTVDRFSNREDNLRKHTTANLPLTVIREACRSMERRGEAPEGTAETVGEELNKMTMDMRDHVGRGGDVAGGTTYYANISRLVDWVRMYELDGTILRRFGQAGLRIFRILNYRGALEQKTVADSAMIPLKEAREVLYRMMAGGYVQLFTLPRTSDHAANRCFFLFEVDMPKLAKRLGADVLHAAFNLRERLEFEKRAESDVFKAVNTSSFTVTASMKARIDRVFRICEVLESCLILLDTQIAIFDDF